MQVVLNLSRLVGRIGLSSQGCWFNVLVKKLTHEKSGRKWRVMGKIVVAIILGVSVYTKGNGDC